MEKMTNEVSVGLSAGQEAHPRCKTDIVTVVKFCGKKMWGQYVGFALRNNRRQVNKVE